jgi:NAD(P)-dependent dehydrogenase (short-subunit alcohol dehydrogenase family)
MDVLLKEKLAMVSGSTAGIGLAIAEGLAREGATVIVNGRSKPRVANAVETIRQKHPGSKLEGFAGDLSTAEGFELLKSEYPDLDILVNNLGIFNPQPFEEISDQEWRKFFEVNVLSGVRLSRYYLPRMKNKNWGRIVFISSESAVQIPLEMIHYGCTKTAQLAISRGLAESTVGTGVTVNAVLPGPTASEGVSDFVAKLAGEASNRRPNSKRSFSKGCVRQAS